MVHSRIHYDGHHTNLFRLSVHLTLVLQLPHSLLDVSSIFDFRLSFVLSTSPSNVFTVGSSCLVISSSMSLILANPKSRESAELLRLSPIT
ncbi:hypothetical protein L596_016625 [Steinernema carpocapsae]|uniref:Uncharacterized protein n=1 Tax=Steinernema carpocapsae TaxID=34508 RepID=A0A4U5NIL3_STECR|nr:hypothetical protein L596_016625 [Steinernema carpocapsae]